MAFMFIFPGQIQREKKKTVQACGIETVKFEFNA